jgi:hypothetical protein
LISIRGSEETPSAEKVARHTVGRKGTAGGHLTYAGGQVPLTTGTKTECEELQKYLQHRFLEAVGVPDGPSTPLVKS